MCNCASRLDSQAEQLLKIAKTKQFGTEMSSLMFFRAETYKDAAKVLREFEGAT